MVFLENINGVSKVFQGSFKKMFNVFHETFKAISRVFPEFFKEVSGKCSAEEGVVFIRDSLIWPSLKIFNVFKIWAFSF